MSKAEIDAAVDTIIIEQQRSEKPLAIILAGHNGSGKSTMWYEHLANKLQIPLVNADRMMMSILPDPPLPNWAVSLRDKKNPWMKVAQKGVQSFVAQAMAQRVPFAMETVFSYWEERDDGTYASKIDTILELQAQGYYVLLLFVGLANVNLSMARVASRKAAGGHNVDIKNLKERFPRTQQAICAALPIADGAILADNSLDLKSAFTIVRIQRKNQIDYDIRKGMPERMIPAAVRMWMEKVCGLAH